MLAGPSGPSPGFSLPSGLAAATVRVTGSGGAPEVVLSGPGGVRVSTLVASGRSDVVVVRIPAADETLVGLRRPPSGHWSVSAAPGSAPVTGVAIAQSLPAPDVQVHVTGRGARRWLSYRLAVAPARTVTFAERGPGVYHTLGVASGPQGRIGFTPAAGQPGRRQIPGARQPGWRAGG